ncbi:TldD/PmbA family protein [Chloroflexota bacterium]
MTDLILPQKIAQIRPELDGLLSDLDSHGAYGSIFLSSKRGLQIRLEGKAEKIVQDEPKDGTILTLYDGQALHERAVNGFDLEKARAGLAALKGSVPKNGHNGRPVEVGAERVGDFVTQTLIPPDSLSTKEKLERLRALRARAKALDPAILDVRLNYVESREYGVFRDRTADLAQHINRLTLFLIVIIADEQGRPKYDAIVKSGTFGWEGLEFSQEELEAKMVDLRALLTAERIQPGEYTIITAPDVSGVLAHESFGHGVETDMYIKERARAAEFVGKQVASPLVSIYDDPSLPGCTGSYFFDDQGWGAAPTQIVDGGIYQRGITDLYSATMLGLPRSANGRRQDFSRKAYARMSNTYFAPGDTLVEDLFAQVEDGIFVDRSVSGMEDPLGWGIQLSCHYGWEIKNGKRTGRLFSPIGMTGYVPDVLKSITAVGDQVEYSGGTCGKGHKERVRVDSGGPHLLMKARLG